MTKPAFDNTKPLVMARFKTVLGHNLNPGTPLVIAEDPSAPGEVDQALAARLWNSGVAAYQDEHRPTPVETPEQEKARLAAEAERDAAEADDAPVPPRQRRQRGSAAVTNPTNSESGEGLNTGSADGTGSMDAGAGEGAEIAADGESD